MDAGCECAPWIRSANPSDSWALVTTTNTTTTTTTIRTTTTNRIINSHWPEDGPLGVCFGLERQYDDDNEDGRDGEAEQIPDERRQPVAGRVDAADELRMLRFVGALVDDEHDEWADEESHAKRHVERECEPRGARLTRSAVSASAERPRQRMIDLWWYSDNDTLISYKVLISNQLHRILASTSYLSPHWVNSIFDLTFAEPIHWAKVKSKSEVAQWLEYYNCPLISLQSSVTAETRYESVYHTHLPRRKHRRSQSRNMYVSSLHLQVYSQLARTV